MEISLLVYPWTHSSPKIVKNLSVHESADSGIFRACLCGMRTVLRVQHGIQPPDLEATSSAAPQPRAKGAPYIERCAWVCVYTRAIQKLATCPCCVGFGNTWTAAGSSLWSFSTWTQPRRFASIWLRTPTAVQPMTRRTTVAGGRVCRQATHLSSLRSHTAVHRMVLRRRYGR